VPEGTCSHERVIAGLVESASLTEDALRRSLYRVAQLEARLENHPYWSERWNEHFESEAQARSAHAMVNAERDWPAPFPEDAPQRRQRKAPRTDEGFFDGPNDNQLDI
jgi:hypothetical protein